MNWIKKYAVPFAPTILISFFLIFALDYFLGHLLAETFLIQDIVERRYRRSDPIYHHGLTADFDGTAIWGDRYQLCTNNSGFKDACNKVRQGRRSFDLAFIGDSFTEGIGLPYEDTFVGQIASRLPQLETANLAVASYSPTIYLAKVRKLLDEGYTFTEVVVYVDISDIQDEATRYSYQDGRVIDLGVLYMPPDDSMTAKVKRVFKHTFPLIYQGAHGLKNFVSTQEANLRGNGASYLDREYERSAWTYDNKSRGYGELGVEGGLEKSLRLMSELSDMLAQRNIRLSVGVYPWPAQLLYDEEESRQVRVWREFCRTRCKNFYNNFPTFFDQIRLHGKQGTIERYFIKGDVHYNVQGAKLIAEEFLSTYEGALPRK